MKKAGAVLMGIAAFATFPVLAHDGGNRFGGNLDGYQEVAASPQPSTISTTGNGRFDLLIDENGREVHWQLSYGRLESPVLQAHIHLGARAIAGGISVFLCTNIGNAPAAPAQPTQGCPQPVGSDMVTISGTFTRDDVIGPAGQGIAAGEFDELLRAIRAGATYANVHTQVRPAGEIRAQLRRGHSQGGRNGN
jgi:hypothetical protein